MIGSAKRKFLQLKADPVLRKWLFGRCIGRFSSPPKFIPHQPPYAHTQLPLKKQQPTWQFKPVSGPFRGTDKAITLRLPGTVESLNSNQAAAFSK